MVQGSIEVTGKNAQNLRSSTSGESIQDAQRSDIRLTDKSRISIESDAED